MNQNSGPSICLIHPPTRGDRGLGASLAGSEHLGLEYISSYLRKYGHDVEIFNLEGSYQSPDSAAIKVSSRQPLWVGVSPTSLSIDWSIDFSNCFKKFNDAPIVFGGNLASSMPSVLFDYIESLDILVIGEGETVALFLTEALEKGKGHLKQVPSILYRDGQRICRSDGDANFLPLDDLPWPDRLITKKDNQAMAARILTSRGCTYRCSFCTTPSFYNRRIRYRSIDDVVREMKYLYQVFGTKNFYINDDIFIDGSSKSINRAKHFARLLEETLPNISFRPLCRADVLLRHPQLVYELHKSGMNCVFVGIESANQNELKYLKKDSKISQNFAIMSLLEQFDISVMIGFIMFTAVSSFESLRNNLEFLNKTDQLYRTTPLCRPSFGFPGTDMYNRMLEKEDYDKERSNPFILYPKFKNKQIRELSVAMEEIEVLFSHIDNKMLTNRLSKYDVRLRQCHKQSASLRKSRDLLNQISKIYYNYFSDAITAAEENRSSDKILHDFLKALPVIEGLSDDFDRMLSKIINS